MPSARLQAVREFVADLGPLRWVVLGVAVVPTVGLLAVLANLPALAVALPHDTLLAIVIAAAAIAVATGSVLLPPGVGALAAGYCIGAWAGAFAAMLGAGIGAVIGQRVVWPIVGARLYPFIRPRARVIAVRRLCAAQPVMGVTVLRLAATFPFSVGNLLLSAARVVPQAVIAGTMLGIAPSACVAAAAGAAWRHWRETGEAPRTEMIVVFAVLAGATARAMFGARRTWRRAMTPPV